MLAAAHDVGCRVGSVATRPARTRRGAGRRRDVDGVGRRAPGQRVGEGDGMRRCGGEHLTQQGRELGLRRVVRPQREDACGVEALREPLQSVAGVEGGVARVQDVVRSVVDVEEDG